MMEGRETKENGKGESAKRRSAIEFVHRPRVGRIIHSALQVGQGFFQDDTLSRYHLGGKEINCPYSALLPLLH